MIGVIKGDTRSLDYSSYGLGLGSRFKGDIGATYGSHRGV